MKKFRGKQVVGSLVPTTKQTAPLTIPVTLGISATLNYRGGAASDGVLVGSLTPQAIDYAYLFDSPAYTDDTTDANDADASDVALMPATETTSDKFYFGQAGKFCGLKFAIGTAGVSSGGGAAAITWEYYNGTTWVTLETSSFVDDTVGFTVSPSTVFVTFAPPTAWAKTTINGVSAYWVRATIAVADFTTQPLATRIWVLELNAGSGVRMPFSGTISAVQMHATTASATNNDTVFLLINTTAGTCDTITWTGADIMDRDETVSLAVTEGDEIALMQLTEDGSTEFAGASMILEVQLAA